MIYKLILITLISILLTACSSNNNNTTTSDNENYQNDNNSYARLSSPPQNEFPDENKIIIRSGDTEPSNINKEEESKDYIANEFENDETVKKDTTQNNNHCLATFTTPILTSDPNRYHNITIVRDRLNGYVLQNNAVFSFNEVCGPYGKDDGFKEATILLSDGSKDKGYGGGVCQLSTTLYNAIKNLKVDITERHHHSVPVAYVKNNEDATVSLQSNLDFKFKNISGKALEFKSESTENSLTVSVYEK